ncbi:MAG: hypothetical protein HPY54_12890 [Chthonomonadetes bacterium]|nr:hypothetical protein [Chthonomonadetes bacterium]
MANFKEGDRVQIVTREQTNGDIKERSYYPYMGGLKGTIYRLYSDGRAAVQIDLDSLPESIRTRHTEAQERMKNRWIEGLSEEARSRLTPEEREFHLNYVLLVRVEDLQPEGKRTRSASAAKGEPSAPAQKAQDTAAPSAKKQTTGAEPEARARSAAAAAVEPELPKRKTLRDLEKAEEEFLKSRARKRG